MGTPRCPTVLQLAFNSGGRPSYSGGDLLQQTWAWVAQQLSHTMRGGARVSRSATTRFWVCSILAAGHRRALLCQSSSCCWPVGSGRGAITACTQPGIIRHRSGAMGMGRVPLPFVVIGGAVPAIRQSRGVHRAKCFAFPLCSVKIVTLMPFCSSSLKIPWHGQLTRTVATLAFDWAPSYNYVNLGEREPKGRRVENNACDKQQQ